MILFFDTETTGLRPGQVCQISYVMQYADKTLAKNMYFTVDSMDTGAEAVHGLSLEKLKVLSGGKRFSDLACEIALDFESADVVVAHNVSFDFMFMRAEFERLKKTFTYNAEFCSMKSMTPICKLARKTGVGYKYPKLSELCEYFGISDESILEKSRILFGGVTGAHDARFDTTALYLAVNRGIETEPVMNFLNDCL